MTARRLIADYLEFFEERGHAIIPSASLVPDWDPEVLFTTAGMHPLVPYLMGETHPLGKRLVNVQKCLRTTDIEDVGDLTHNTFFLMLGNWSLGDYFKKESLTWSLEFVVEKLALERNRIYATIFEGDADAPFDQESKEIWLSLGLPEERILPLPKEDNWWGPAGAAGPCGPDSEIFYDTGKNPCGADCRPGDNCGRFFEIWNNVFMEFNKTPDGKFIPLAQKNVDTGLGVERTTAMLEGVETAYETELFQPIIKKIDSMIKTRPAASLPQDSTKPKRIVADHLRAVTFALADGAYLANKGRGYIVRRLIRRAVRWGREIGLKGQDLAPIAEVVVSEYQDLFPELKTRKTAILEALSNESENFAKVLNRGLLELENYLGRKEVAAKPENPARFVFDLYQSYGFPPEMTLEEVRKIKPEFKMDEEKYHELVREHQEKSK